jgi:hypothetical protein
VFEVEGLKGKGLGAIAFNILFHQFGVEGVEGERF